jgi:hypothetical protein
VASVNSRIRDRIQASPWLVLLRGDFGDIASRSAVSRELKTLCAEGLLVRIGIGLYAKTRVSSVTGAVIPAGPLEVLTAEALRRLGIEVRHGAAARAYNAGITSQLPGQLVANTGRRRISRVIAVGGRRLHYERD